ncbi:C2 domain [Pseudocohnilembus persalinus]|uniref:C2 domain n=1 Tax=Pseudocohnilembus persalinus TaxID=266149 RepID=A0A0V0R6A8_PSEPJ|nr:C2 domain [Pseudocohnilembus persalinus]|eukprot:KRX10045.1 C2 domain [Pseudocohnilembus persalinus]
MIQEGTGLQTLFPYNKKTELTMLAMEFRNSLDVYLGVIDISEPDARILTEELVPNLRNLLSFVTVDFFNHDTQHSTITEGIKSKINFQVSFKVDIDEFLYKHITTNSIKLELYCGNGEEPLKLGEGSIPLLDLDVKNDQPDKSYVLGGTTFIKGFKDNGKQAIEVAVIEYRVRFKYPVFEKFQSIKQQMKLHKELSYGFEEPEEEFYGTSKRKLVFLFDKITNLSEQDSTFIYFSFNGIDYHTTVKEGSQPFWDQEDRIVITILYDEQMRNKFKEDTIEFVIFNDNASINNNNSRALRTDVIGSCRVPLADLNKANVLDLKLDILSEDDHNNKLKIKNQKESDNEKKQLFVKILWTDSTDFNQRPQMKQNQQNDTWSQEVTYKIAQALKARYLNLNNSFMIFDRDQDEIISFEDFETTIRGTLGMNQLKKEEIELYYSRLPQPYDWESFSKQFRPYLDHMGKINGIPQFDDNFFIEKKQPDNLSQINQIVQENTNNLYQNKDLQKFEKLREQIHDILGRQMEIQSKSLNQLFLEVDKDNNGFLSHLEFKTFLHKYGIKAQDKELQQFLDCLDKDGDEQINIQEFQDYIMYQGSNISPKKLSSISKRDSESNVNSRLLVNFIDQAIDGIIEYMKQNKKTFLMIYQEMDANGDNYVSKQELKSFLQDKVGLKMNLNELNMVLNHFDQSDDNKISVKEFVETMKDKARSKQRQSRNASDYNKLFTGVQRQRNVSQLIEVFVSYIQLNNLQISTMFNAIDANQDGTLSKKEMKQLFIERLRINIDDDEFNEFYHYFDQNQNDSVSISEFVKAIQPKLEEVKYQKQNKKNYPDDYINLLRKKATDATKRYGDELQQFFEAYEIEQGKPFITKQDFKKQIQNVIPMRSEFYFTDEDLLALIDQICSINLSGFVNYKHFLGLGSEKHHELADNKSMMVSKQMTSEIFKKIRSVLKKEKLSIRKAFQAFDLNRDGKIGAKELYECFKQMGLDYSSDDIDLIVLAVDKNKNGEITFEEFEKALNEAK